MKRTLAAIFTTLALIVGGVAVSTPAQADMGTDVKYHTSTAGVPDTAKLWVTKVNGSVYGMSLGSIRHDIEKVCPHGNRTLSYQNPRGTIDVLQPGQCLYPSLVGLYYVSQHA